MILPLTLGVVAIGAGLLDGPERSLLDRLTGEWVMRGKIAGSAAVHDVRAAWVLNREYVEIHETSREKGADGKPRYEAIVYVSWDPKKARFACLWMDTTAVSSFSPIGVGRLGPDGHSIRFVFGSRDDGIETTFRHDPRRGAWSWSIDNLSRGKGSAFARLALTKKGDRTR